MKVNIGPYKDITLKRNIKIKIDKYDTWSADNTLALLIVPLLKALKEKKGGAPLVDDDDVPEELKSTSAPPLTEDEKNCGSVDDNYFKRWDWIIDEMIWSFEQSTFDWEELYYSGDVDYQLKKLSTGNFELVKGPNHTFKVDEEGTKKHRERMLNGRMLFAKYYESLWT